MKTTPYLLSAMLLAGCAVSAPESDDRLSRADREGEECGEASYYADSLSGNATASGEAYRPGKLTAAHKTLAFGTEVRVVRQDTGRSVDVRINDRGPFTPGRIIDLSRAAAEKIDLVEAGRAQVCIYAQ